MYLTLYSGRYVLQVETLQLLLYLLLYNTQSFQYDNQSTPSTSM